MATIKFKRGAGFPTGLTGYEPAWDTTFGRLFLHNGSTAIWIGAQIDGSTALTGNCAYTVPTQQAVKSYVDSNIAAGAVSSINGLVGAVTLRTDSSSGITLDVGSGGITLAHNVVFESKSTALNRYIGYYGVTAGKAVPYTNDNLVYIPSSGTIKGTRGIALQGFTSDVFGGNYSEISVKNDGITLATNGGAVNITNTNTALLTNPSSINLWYTDSGSNIAKGTITTAVLGANRTYTFPDSSGTVALTSTSVASVAGITGAVNITGTTNQVSTAVSGQTLTISLPSAVTMPGSLTVTGDLTVNGTTTTVNSTTVTVQDPVIAIGGLTGNAVPSAGDVKDRGLIFQYRAQGVTGSTGFFGYDNSSGYFVFAPTISSLTNDVVGWTAGTLGTINVNGIRSETQTALTLTGVNASNAVLSAVGAASASTSYVSAQAGYLLVGDATSANGVIKLYGTSGNYTTSFATSALTADTTLTLPLHSGTLVAPTNLGTSGYILKANGTSSQPTWVDPATTAAGTLVTAEANGTYYLAMASGVASGGTGFYVDTTAQALTYVTSTGTLTCTKVEAIVDGGSFP